MMMIIRDGAFKKKFLSYLVPHSESFPDFEEVALFHTSQTGESGDYICQNVLTIWLKLRNSPPDLREKYSEIRKPRDIGEAIKKNLPTYAIDMIGKEHYVEDVGFVPLSLSGEWLAKSIHMMLKHGIETWAPKLPVEMVSVNSPALDDENRVGVFQREAIKLTLRNMLKYSKVYIQPEPKVPDLPLLGEGIRILVNSFSIDNRETHVVIKGKETLPFILTMDDFFKSCIDLSALREVTISKTVDWVVFVAPVRQQEYIEMCFTAARHEKWIVTDRNVQWNPTLRYEYPVATYAGYRTCSIEQGDLLTLLRQVRVHCDSVAEGTPGTDGPLLGYSGENVFHGVLLYTCLKNDRLADCTFNFNEMVEEKGNTFVYLLRTRAEIKGVTDPFRRHINELKNQASNLIWKTYEEWEEIVEHVERALEFCLLKFAEAGYVAEESKLLLCEATAVVMDKCFQLLGINRKSLIDAQRWYDAFVEGKDVTEPDKKKNQRWLI